METINWLISNWWLSIPLTLIGLYVIFRLIFMAIFNSWFDVKSQNKRKEEPK